MAADLTVRDVPKWEHRLYLRCKYVPWALLMMAAILVSIPLIFVLALFDAQFVIQGLDNVMEVVQARDRKIQAEFRRFGAKAKT